MITTLAQQARLHVSETAKLAVIFCSKVAAHQTDYRADWVAGMLDEALSEAEVYTGMNPEELNPGAQAAAEIREQLTVTPVTPAPARPPGGFWGQTN